MKRKMLGQIVFPISYVLFMYILFTAAAGVKTINLWCYDILPISFLVTGFFYGRHIGVSPLFALLVGLGILIPYFEFRQQLALISFGSIYLILNVAGQLAGMHIRNKKIKKLFTNGEK